MNGCSDTAGEGEGLVKAASSTCMFVEWALIIAILSFCWLYSKGKKFTPNAQPFILKLLKACVFPNLINDTKPKGAINIRRPVCATKPCRQQVM